MSHLKTKHLDNNNIPSDKKNIKLQTFLINANPGKKMKKLSAKT